jgi:TPR repeat protein
MYTHKVETANYYSIAVKSFRKAYDNGHTQGATNLGLLYEQGLGVVKSYKNALQCFNGAAKKGYPIAQYRVGRCHEYGYGTKEDIQCALKWYSKSAVQCYDLAKSKLKYLTDSDHQEGKYEQLGGGYK